MDHPAVTYDQVVAVFQQVAEMQVLAVINGQSFALLATLQLAEHALARAMVAVRKETQPS